MSDFVSRVAARAVGRTAAARPRLPALFEPAGAVADLEVVEEVAVRHPRTIGPSPAAGPSPQPPASTQGERRPPARRGSHPALAEQAAARGLPSPVVRRDERRTPTARRRAPTREAIVEERTVAEHATVLVAAAAPAATVAAAPAALVKQPAPPEPQPARSAPAPQPVRVHIGRLEVRANLQEPPRPQRAAERPRPQELSLGDYLRGRRSAP